MGGRRDAERKVALTCKFTVVGTRGIEPLTSAV